VARADRGREIQVVWAEVGGGEYNVGFAEMSDGIDDRLNELIFLLARRGVQFVALLVLSCKQLVLWRREPLNCKLTTRVAASI
jgi:hypothetical protein